MCMSAYIGGVWRRRHDMNNRIPHLFQPMLTGSVDTFPVVVSRPMDKHIAKYLYNGKYCKHILKVRSHIWATIDDACVHVYMCVCVHDFGRFKWCVIILLPHASWAVRTWEWWVTSTYSEGTRHHWRQRNAYLELGGSELELELELKLGRQAGVKFIFCSVVTVISLFIKFTMKLD